MDTPAVRYAKTSDGVNIAYWELGEGPTLLLMTASGGNIRVEWEIDGFRDSYRRLAERFHLVGMDIRNYGLSDRGVRILSLSALESDIAAVVSALDVDRVALFAPFRSTPAALAYAAANPEQVSALVTWCGVANGGRLLESDTPKTIVPASEGSWKVYADLVANLVFRASGESLEEISRYFQASITQEDFQAWRETTRMHDASDRLPLIVCPTLVMHRDGQIVVSEEFARELASGISGSTLQMVAGDNMSSFLYDSEEVVDAITSFVLAAVADDSEPNATLRASSFQTIMFTDLESSTALTQKFGDEAAQDILHGHNDAVRKSLEDNGGREVKHTGDGIMAAFPSAVRAVQAALQIQRDLAGGEVRVRIGLNAGEPIAEDDDFFGTAVQLAARICDRAEPGQVLVSRVVADLCAGKQLSFESAGEAHMKGFDEPVALFEVGG